MGRRNRRTPADAPRPLSGSTPGGERVGTREGDWLFHPVSGANAAKYYVCPECSGDIPPGMAHVVAWPDTWSQGLDDRRHWHTGCWHVFLRRAGQSEK